MLNFSMLKLASLSKSFGPTLLFRDLSLVLEPGEYVAVMGDSGSGKSTFLNLVAGLEPVDAGVIELDGRQLSTLDDESASQWRRQSLGFVFQAFHVLPYLTVAQNIALPLQLNHWPEAEAAARANEMLAAVQLSDRADSYPAVLSGGETQRVAIARALAHRPRLVLADEPTGNLDPDTATAVLALLAQEIRRNNAAGILVTHSMTAARTTDRILRLTQQGLVSATP